MALPSPTTAVKLRLLSPFSSSSSSSSSSSTPYRPVVYLNIFHNRFLPKASISNGGLDFSVTASSIPTCDHLELHSSIGSPPSIQLTQWNLGPKHISLLNVTACAVAISSSWLFFSAIPALLAFRKAADSLQKLLEVTAEELPDTMAAVRLSGMEISDLTTELSDLGQEITQGVRSSTRAVRVAEDRIRGLTNMTPPKVSSQGREGPMEKMNEPTVAKAARDLREGVTKGRAIFAAIFSILGFTRWAFGSMSRTGNNKNPTKKK